MPKKKHVPSDFNQLAAHIMEKTTGQPLPAAELTEKEARSAAAKILGRLGGLRGGKARAAKLSPQRRKQIARDAVNARWNKKRKKS